MSDTTPRLAKTIRVTQENAAKFSLEIDGQEFPWYIAAGGVTVAVARGELPSVTLTLVAECVLVDNDIRSPAEVARDEAVSEHAAGA